MQADVRPWCRKLQPVQWPNWFSSLNCDCSIGDASRLVVEQLRVCRKLRQVWHALDKLFSIKQCITQKKKVKTCLPSNNTAWDVGSISRQVTKDAYVGVVKVQSQNACFWSTVTLASVCCSSLSCISVEHRSKLQLCKSQDPITSQHATVLQFLTFNIDEQAANMPNSDILSWQWHMLGLC